jgi:hypothetical protein
VAERSVAAGTTLPDAALGRRWPGALRALRPAGWGEYNTVRADIRLLAVDCGVWQQEM